MLRLHAVRPHRPPVSAQKFAASLRVPSEDYSPQEAAKALPRSEGRWERDGNHQKKAMKTNFQQIKLAPGLRVQSSNHQRKGRAFRSNPNTKGDINGDQRELFAVVWMAPAPRKFRLNAGDVIRLNGKLGRVIRVNECSAVIVINQHPRQFTTRFDRHVRFQPKPATLRISPNSEVQILNR